MLCTFDGACEPNPGGAIGWGWTIGEDAFHGSAPPAPNNTNNLAEYAALIALLEMLKDRGIAGQIHGDSELVVMQMNGEYAVRSSNLIASTAYAQRLLAETHSTISWHPRDDNGTADAESAKGLAEQGHERLDLSLYTSRLGGIGNARQIGKWLKDHGYRKSNGHANEKAEAEGLGKVIFYHGFWTTFWHVEHVRKQIEEKGWNA
jgi:ribonuclease HI